MKGGDDKMRAGDVAEWQSAGLACLRLCVPYPAWHKPSMVIYVCNPGTWEVQFKVILDYIVTSSQPGTLNQN